jgi:CTP synthase
VCGLKGAQTTEVDPKTPYPVIDFLPLQEGLLEQNQYGGTMRLGAYTATIKQGSAVEAMYHNSKQAELINGTMHVTERHRHRYEVNNRYVKDIENNGGIFSGYFEHQTGIRLMEFFELPNHPFFVSTQAHPEFTSRFGSSHPLFLAFLKKASNKKRMK